MHSKSGQKVAFNPGLADLLACPVCHGNLRLEAEYLICGGCGLRFPVVDGIPVLIAGRAEAGRTN